MPDRHHENRYCILKENHRLENAFIHWAFMQRLRSFSYQRQCSFWVPVLPICPSLAFPRPVVNFLLEIMHPMCRGYVVHSNLNINNNGNWTLQRKVTVIGRWLLWRNAERWPFTNLHIQCELEKNTHKKKPQTIKRRRKQRNREEGCCLFKMFLFSSVFCLLFFFF